jgi:S-adenosylmethionine:tRNA ribosyltransferase-isomerase
MLHPKQISIEDYQYELPEEKIAQYPLDERDASKLLIYNDGILAEDTYAHIAEYIPVDSLVVFNHTKVVYTRLLFTKPTGGQIEVFCLEPGADGIDIQAAMLQKGSVEWTCMIGGAGKWKQGMVLQMMANDGSIILKASVISRNGAIFKVLLSWNDTEPTFAEVLQKMGKVPLPPYMDRAADTTDEQRYQTIYAINEGSVAAPTAGLHFTQRVFDNFSKKSIKTAYVTLHVGAGTFMPVKSDTMEGHDMHAEWIDVDIAGIEQLMKQLEGSIVAVGTTSMRTLESLYWIGCRLLNKETIHFNEIAVNQWYPYENAQTHSAHESLKAVVHYLQQHNLSRLVTRTQILIAPGYTFRIVKALVTNFHQPKSTLLLLVAAGIGPAWKDVYTHALQHNYRFLSYGDGSLLWLDKGL